MSDDEKRIVEFLRRVAARYHRDADAWREAARRDEREVPGYEWKHSEAMTVERMAMLIEGGEHRRERATT